MSDNAPVDLDSLSKKQLVKQFKTVAKEIKSKDLEVKTNVLLKLKDHRYFFDGGCLQPFFESMTPKKKTLDMVKMTIDYLSEFLKGPGNGRKALVSLRASAGGLHPLEQLCACSAYHEVPKKAKKGQPPILEDENAVQLRVASSNALYNLVSTLNAAPLDAHLLWSFSDVPNVIPNLCQALKCLLPSFENEETREGCIDHLSKGLYCLSSSMASAHAPAMLAAGTPAMLTAFLKEKKLTVYCLDIIYKMLLHTDGFTEFASSENIREQYAEVLQTTVEDLVASVGAGAADAPPAKDAKGGKAAKPAKGADPNAGAAEAEAKADERRTLACQLKLLAAIHLIIATSDSVAISSDRVDAIAKAFLSVVLNSELWKICNACVSSSRAPNVSLLDTVALICAFLGSVAQKDDSCRSADALDTLSAVLLKSRSVCDVAGDGPSFLPADHDAAAEDFATKRIRVRKTSALLSLRRIVEKAMLHLMTSPSAETGRVVSTYQWVACAGLTVSTAVTDGTCKAIVLKLLDAVVGPDEDLSNRIARLISGVIQCAPSTPPEDGEEGPVTALGLSSAALATKIGTFVAARAKSFHKDVEDSFDQSAGDVTLISPRELSRTATLQREANALGISVQELQFFKWEDGEHRGLRHPRLRDDAAVPDAEAAEGHEGLTALLTEAQNETADYLFPSTDESLIHGLYLLDAILPYSVEVVTAIGTKDVVSSLVNVLYTCGPTGSNGKSESMCRLFDPRIYNWREEHDHRNERRIGEFSMVPVRGIAISVLKVLAEADAKYRRHEGEIPCAPQTAAPVSTSTGYGPASLVSKLAADVCFSSLMANSRLYFSDLGEMSCGPATNSSCLLGIDAPSECRQDVTNSLLGLAAAIGSCGLVGLSNCYEGIASSAVESPHYKNALSSIASSIEAGVAAGVSFGEVDVGLSELLHTPFDWQFPMLFQFSSEGNEELPISAAQILSRKDLWPVVVAASAIIGVLCDPRASSSTARLAVSVIQNFAQVATMGDVNQPAIADLFAAVFIALGGCTALLSSVSSFGILFSSDSEIKSKAVGLLTYIISRGVKRQAYWDQVLEAKLQAARDAAAAAEAAGGKGKKDDKKAAAKDDKKADKGKKGAPVEEERRIEVPVEPDETHADPNHGPTVANWASLLNVSSNCYLSRTERATPLSSLCQSLLSAEEESDGPAVLAALISAGVDVNKLDGAGISPLMYALVIGNRLLVNSLLQAGASPNVIDSRGVPTVVYAFLSISTDLLNSSLKNLIASERRMIWGDEESRDSKAIACSGVSDLLSMLLDSHVDLQVATSTEGNYPLHFACGIAQIGITIGGVRFELDNLQYSANFSKMNTSALITSLIDHGALSQSCNKAGILPVHIAAASGDTASIEVLLTVGGGELANTADFEGYLPLHYAAAACPRHAFEVINSLLKWGNLRPIRSANFADARTGLTDDEKYWYDVEAAMAKALSFGEIAAEAVSMHRASKRDIVRTSTKAGLTSLHLVLAGRALCSSALARLMSPWDNVTIRVAVAEMLCDIGGEDVLLAGGDAHTVALSAIHTLSLLGVTPEKPNAFLAGSLRVIAVTAKGFVPPMTEQMQSISVKVSHGDCELITSSAMNSREEVEQHWVMPVDSSLDLSSTCSEMIVSVWSEAKCIGRGAVSLGAIARGQLLVGEEITVRTMMYDEVFATPCGSVSISLRTVNDEESTGVSGPMFSCQTFFSRILKSVGNNAEMCSSTCSWNLQNCKLPENWTPLHACVLSQNRILATAIISINKNANIEWTEFPYLHFTANNCSNMTFCNFLIEAYGRLKPAVLNKIVEDVYPLHAAVRCKNAALVSALADCPRVNLNARDTFTGSTAFLEACRNTNAIRSSDLFAAFQRNADRLDFFVSDNSGETCIDYAIRNKEFELVQALCEMRANDVVEKVISVQSNSNESILLTLEKENVNLTKIAYALREEKQPEVAAVGPEFEEEEDVMMDPLDIFPGSAGTKLAAIESDDALVVVVGSGEATATEMSQNEALHLLGSNDKLLSVLLKCVIESSVAPPPHFHVHDCFVKGMLMREYQEVVAVDVVTSAVAAVSILNEFDAVIANDDENSRGPETWQNEHTDTGLQADLHDKVGEYSPITKELRSFDDGVASS